MSQNPRQPPPRVAVIVRTKDRPQFLRRALADIDAQTFTDYAVVVVNDAGAPEQVDAVVAAAPGGVRDRITVLHRSESVGMEAASNAGLRASASEFCAIHDDDDLWEPQFLERTVAFLDAHPDTEMVAVRVTIRYEDEVDGEFVETGRVPFWGQLPAITIEDLFVINRVVPIGIVYRRRLHDELGFFDETLPVVGDWEFNMRVASRHEIELLDEPLAHWCQRPDATGAVANSIFEMHALHLKFDLKLRAAAIRDDLANGGHVGPYLFQAHLAHGLTRRLEQQDRDVAAGLDAINRRLDALEERLNQAIARGFETIDQRLDGIAREQSDGVNPRFDAIDERFDALTRLVTERTSPIDLVRRGLRGLRRRPVDE